MNVKLTDAQVRTMMALAVNASNPGGPQSLGWFQYAPEKTYTAEDFKDNDITRDAYLDYVDGRMVKLSMRHMADGTWDCPDHEPRSDYQSWVRVYPTYQALVDAAVAVVKV